MDKEYAKACSACESTRKPVHCPDCLNGPILKEKRLHLQQLKAQKTALLEQLVPQLSLRVSGEPDRCANGCCHVGSGLLPCHPSTAQHLSNAT